LIVHGRASHAGLAHRKESTPSTNWRSSSRASKDGTITAGRHDHAGIIEGGTRTNVIPERARAVLDLRALRGSDMSSVERRLNAIRPFHRGARVEITGGFDRPPLERKMSVTLFARAKSLSIK